MKKTILWAAVLTATLGTGLAQAYGPGMGGGDRHERRAMMREQMDLNKDGGISDEERRAFMAARAKEMDANGDGFIAAEEMTAHRDKMRTQQMQERMARLDANKDGKISVDEFANAGGQRPRK